MHFRKNKDRVSLVGLRSEQREIENCIPLDLSWSFRMGPAFSERNTKRSPTICWKMRMIPPRRISCARMAKIVRNSRWNSFLCPCYYAHRWIVWISLRDYGDEETYGNTFKMFAAIITIFSLSKWRLFPRWIDCIIFCSEYLFNRNERLGHGYSVVNPGLKIAKVSYVSSEVLPLDSVVLQTVIINLLIRLGFSSSGGERNGI